MSEEKVGLVLAGGGAKGAYQAEVAARIFDDIDPDIITGVSAGALNGSILAQNSPNKLQAIWALSRKKDVWSGGHTLWRYLQMAFGWKLGLYDPDPLIKTVQNHFDPNDVEIPFQAGAVRLSTGEFTSFEIDPDTAYTEAQKKKARRFVVASSAVPVGVEPVEVDGDLMIDGGTRNIAPVGSVIDRGCDRVIVITNSRLDNKFSGPDHADSVFDIGSWTLDILLNETIRSDIRITRAVNDFVESSINPKDLKYDKIPVDVIQPSEPIGKANDFSREAWASRVEVAKKDAEGYMKD